MRKIHLYILTIFLLISNHAIAQNSTVNFDKNWHFHLGGLIGGEHPLLDDSKWRILDLPHDWSIEDRPGTRSPFNKDAISQVNGGFTAQGTAWYRKSFTVPVSDKNKHVIIQFDGVYMNADVYVNGQHVGNHPYGYTSFYYDITPQLKFGNKNIVAVEVKNEGQNSRWYSGSGIYRHVWLKTLGLVHIAQWGTFIATSEVSESSAKLSIKTQLVNDGTDEAPITLITRFVGPDGNEACKTSSRLTLNGGERKEVSENGEIKNPALWSCERPVLYKAITEIYQNGKLINSEQNTLGIRSISFGAKNGFQLNGKQVKLKGGCFHNDNGPLGACAFDRAEERKVELLKASGYNAIRCSHNPPSPAFLNACDRLGMLVIDEAYDMWNYAKNPYDYHLYFGKWGENDMESMVTRDRNHPSIVMWSIGNEIPERATEEGVQTAKILSRYVKELDPTRAVTAAVNGLNPDKDPFFAALDIGGYNYAAGGDHLKAHIYADDHERVPERIMFGSESYPLEAFDSWTAVEDSPYVIGDFVWTAWDYIGEASIGWLGYPQNSTFYPWNLAFCGDIDICGWKRPQSYYRDALWKSNQLSIFVSPPVTSFKPNPNKASWSKWNWADVLPDWNWKGHENKPLAVSVYSSCEKVELLLNNKSLGVKSTNRLTRFTATWLVPYAAGELKAIGYNGNKKVKTASLHTAGQPIAIKLFADHEYLEADKQDLSYVTVDITDEHGYIAPKAEDLISFSLTGDAKIIGVGNANPLSLESFQLSHRKAWKGKCLVIIRAGKKPGEIILHAKGSGLRQANIRLIARAPSVLLE
jgi:beta-galactosidase